MYIDIHTHLSFDKIYPFAYLNGMLDGSDVEIDDRQLKILLQLFLNDKFAKRFVKQMDDAKVDKSVVLIIDGGIKLGEAFLSIEQIHELHFEVLKQYPERFIMFAGIDPRRGDAGFKLFQKSIFEYGFKGLKLYPPMGYAFDDKSLDRYYQICHERHLSVLIHTGPSLSNLENHFANPVFIEKISSKYFNANFILAHAGCRLNNSDIKRVLKIPNVYADIAGFQTFFTKDDKINIRVVEKIFEDEFNGKILFGSDWPLFNLFSPLEKHIKIIQDLFWEHHSGDEIIKLENILYRNAYTVLKI